MFDSPSSFPFFHVLLDNSISLSISPSEIFWHIPNGNTTVMARLSDWHHLKEYLSNSIIIAHLSTLVSVLKVKLDRSSPVKLLALKANLICQVAWILCYCHVERSRYSFRQHYRPQTLHRLDHIWNDIVNTQLIYNNKEFLRFLVLQGAHLAELSYL